MRRPRPPAAVRLDGSHPWGCGGRFSPDAYAQLAQTFGTYSREHNGNKVYRIAAGASSDDYVWTDVLMRTLGFRPGAGHPDGDARRAFEAISFHHYTVPGSWTAKGSATVAPQDYDGAVVDHGRLRVSVPPYSFVTVSLSVSA